MSLSFLDATYFFKGGNYWKFINRIPEPGYPKSISGAWGGIPNNIDTAFEWAGNGKTYFFKVITSKVHTGS